MAKGFLFLLLVAGFACAEVPGLTLKQAHKAYPVVSHLAPPESLRPCCAFGYDLHVRAIGVPIPVYQIGNVLTLNSLGRHHYNDSALGAVKNIVGLSEEKDGLLYTHRGGFIDIAHVRDTADNTFYLFSRIYPKLGQQWRFFTAKNWASDGYSYTVSHLLQQWRSVTHWAAWLAGNLAFELAQWHEIAQWYGFESVPGFSEQISAFSPEDLYSNLLGARIAINVILQGRVESITEYNAAVDRELQRVLLQLGVATRTETERKFRELDGDWWNSKRRVPDKFLVLKRNYNLEHNRLPTPVSYENATPLQLTFPAVIEGYRLARLGELQIYPGTSMQSLPRPKTYYAPDSFQSLADTASEADKIQLERMHKSRF